MDCFFQQLAAPNREIYAFKKAVSQKFEKCQSAANGHFKLLILTGITLKRDLNFYSAYNRKIR